MKKSRAGFTLIEVTVALAILAGGIVVVNTAWSGNLLRVRKTRLYHNLADLLERKQAELEVRFRDRPIANIPDEEQGDFGSDYPDYRWEYQAKSLELPDLRPLIQGENGGIDDNLASLITQMTDALSAAIKELQLKVIAKYGTKEVSAQLTTYYVDYNLPLPFAAAPAQNNAEAADNEAAEGEAGAGAEGDAGEE